VLPEELSKLTQMTEAIRHHSQGHEGGIVVKLVDDLRVASIISFSANEVRRVKHRSNIIFVWIEEFIAFGHLT